ncbi:MAG: hypothetical protein PHD53_06020 [Methylococcales bacterium]|nr:hypothetical protein [Methylococcales bacterium]
MTSLRALTCQTLAFLVTLGFAHWLPIFHSPIVFLLMQSSLAVGSSLLLRQPMWWIPIHLLFLPSVFISFTLGLPAWFYLLIVILLTLIFWGTIRGDVPLFLSSPEVTQAVMILLQQEHAQTFADLGAGVSSVAIPVAKKLPEINVEAWERAPLPWLISKWRGGRLSNFAASRRNFFVADFGKYDVIFAFLSPLAMPEVSEKIKSEMRPGTLFVSSSFPAPNWQPESIQHINDRRKTVLFCYRI